MKGGKKGREPKSSASAATRGKPKKTATKHGADGPPKKGSPKKPFGGMSSDEIDDRRR